MRVFLILYLLGNPNVTILNAPSLEQCEAVGRQLDREITQVTQPRFRWLCVYGDNA